MCLRLQVVVESIAGEMRSLVPCGMDRPYSRARITECIPWLTSAPADGLVS